MIICINSHINCVSVSWASASVAVGEAIKCFSCSGSLSGPCGRLDASRDVITCGGWVRTCVTVFGGAGGVSTGGCWYKNNYSMKNSDGQIDFIVRVFHSSLHVSHDFYVN